MTSNGPEPARDDLDEGWDVEPPAKTSVTTPAASLVAQPPPSRAPLRALDLDSTPVDSEWDSVLPPVPPARSESEEAPPQRGTPTPSSGVSTSKARKLLERKRRAEMATEKEAKKAKKRDQKAAQRKAARAQQAKVAPKQAPSVAAPPPKRTKPSGERRVRNQAPARSPKSREKEVESAEGVPESERPASKLTASSPKKLDLGTLLGIAIIVLLVVVAVWFVARR